MSAVRKMPLPVAFKLMVEAEPEVTIKQWAKRYECTDMAVRRTAKLAGIKIKRPPNFRKGYVGSRLTADQVSVADGIVSTAAHRLTDFRMTVETPEDRQFIDAAISGSRYALNHELAGLLAPNGHHFKTAAIKRSSETNILILISLTGSANNCCEPSI